MIETCDYVRILDPNPPSFSCVRNDDYDTKRNITLEKGELLFVFDIDEETITCIDFGGDEIYIPRDYESMLEKVQVVPADDYGFVPMEYYRPIDRTYVFMLDDHDHVKGGMQLDKDDLVMIECDDTLDEGLTYAWIMGSRVAIPNELAFRYEKVKIYGEYE